MAYGEFGGSGSIAWKVDVDDKDGKKKASAYGQDDNGATGFTLTIKFKNKDTAKKAWKGIRDVVAKLTDDDVTLVLTIPVEPRHEDQVKVAW